MITGAVNANREAIIRLSVLDAHDQRQVIDAVVDTGFNGSLTLPPIMITSLGLIWRSRGSAILANGSMEECDIYAGVVVWDGEPCSILIEAADTDPLVGMSLIYGYELLIQAIDGGTVTLSRL
jgi:clan AA aspartic protease